MKAEELIQEALKEFGQIFQENQESKGIVKFNKVVDRLIESLTRNEKFWAEYFEFLLQESTSDLVKLHMLDIKQFIHGRSQVIFKEAFPDNHDEFLAKFENKFYAIFTSFISRPEAYDKMYELKLKGISNAT